MRTGRIARKTAETDILVEVNLDGIGAYDVSTGIGFLDHMVEQFSRHSLIDVTLKVQGDLHIDQHHTTEDSAIALGQALAQALGDKGGIGRYGAAYSPMDETLSRVALDISGRPFLVWKARFTQEKLGEWDTELVEQSRVTLKGATLPQLTEVELPPCLEPDDEEEERHQAAVHPLAKIQRDPCAAEVDRQRRPPERVVGRRVDVDPDECGDRRRQEDRRAAGLGAEELSQRRLEVPRPGGPARERRRPGVRFGATHRQSPAS